MALVKRVECMQTAREVLVPVMLVLVPLEVALVVLA